MQVILHYTLDECDALAADWAALAEGVPFRSPQWHLNWWKHFGQGPHASRGRRLFVLSVRNEAGQVVGIAPWYLQQNRRQGRLLRFLGSGRVCSDHQTILCQEQHAEQVTAAIAQWLTIEGRKHWQRLELTGIDGEDQIIPRLVEALAARGRKVHQRLGPTCWRVSLSSSWERFLAGISNSRRRKAQRNIRRMVRSGRAVVHTVSTVAEYEQISPIFRELHQKRRASLRQRGCFDSPAFEAFLLDVGRDLIDSGQLDVFWLEIDGQAAALDFCPKGPGVMYGYQSGMDPDLLQFNPGHLLIASRIQSAIERGDKAIDFLRGDQLHKISWGAKARPSIEYRIVQNQSAALVRHSAWLAEQQSRQVAKQGLSFATAYKRRAQQFISRWVGRTDSARERPPTAN